MMGTHEVDTTQSNKSAKILYRPFGIVASMVINVIITQVTTLFIPPQVI